ncbi:Thioesterase-like superfamily protein [Trujillonella endophytica]|uniref:Thioesterase-like superfamily protein n=1 Tax=Trujillonella endophytica TaxID=673521 RepID=A0A1H8V391_9ACTN|nr:Thioesterase-like superfamily protein [Trujillella endophytica]
MPQNHPESAFDRATAVSVAEGGGAVAELDPGWEVGGGILNGGYLMAIAARAALLGSPHPHPVAVSATFLRASAGGPASVSVTSGPAGRTLANGVAVLSTDAGPALTAQVTTATLGEVPVDWSAHPMPAVPAPEACVAALRPDGVPTPGLVQRLDIRFDPATTGWTEGRPAAEPRLRAWMRLSDGREPDPLALLLFADALPPAAYAIGRMGWAPTVQLQVLVRALPAPGWCLVENVNTEVAGGWTDEDCRIWDSTGRLVAQSRQLARLPR